MRRRDLSRKHSLQPRDLRRIDPSLSPTKTSSTITLKEDCILINLGGVRAIITSERCLLFEPYSQSSKKFVEILCSRLLGSAAARAQQEAREIHTEGVDLQRERLLMKSNSQEMNENQAISSYNTRVFPFELEVLEAAFQVCTGKLESQCAAAERRVQAVLQKLPREISPKNLEELRRVKQLLVELESKAGTIVEMLEEIMDDDDELRELNLSSRPIREEKRRQRERDWLESEMEREWAEREKNLDDAGSTNGSSMEEIRKEVEKARNGLNGKLLISGKPGEDEAMKRPVKKAKGRVYPSKKEPQASPSMASSKWRGMDIGRHERDMAFKAQNKLMEMEEEEEEERELEETEDLFEYYVQRASMTQSEAERLLAGARDLEESIGVSLSYRRFEVNRLELLLSIASFAAALGAMIASIFGMNLKSTFEESIIGFWGTTLMICLGSAWVFWVLYRYTKRKRIL